MRVLTWNVYGNPKALNLGLTYLSRLAASEEVLACFQELPRPLPPSLEPGRLSMQGLAAAPALAEKRVLFVYSRGISRVNLWPSANDRLQIVELRLGSGAALFAAGLHAIDRRNYTVAEVRGAYAALTRRALDERWRDGTPLLLLGDFNAWPDLPELAHRACIFGVSAGYEHRAGFDSFFGRKSPPLFRVEPAPGPLGSPLGTYFDPNDSAWRDLDHIYVSRSLLPAARAERLVSIGQVSLLTRYGRPSKNEASDHLPVEARVALA
ncbi:MAG TPA: endonuclease/exonuclease/phosphatase family protein [Polyangiaceae bacterium]|nr:endonuclease/exonuclease/phosphatase family protein [Polyangiaceae bacterium]